MATTPRAGPARPRHPARPGSATLRPARGPPAVSAVHAPRESDPRSDVVSLAAHAHPAVVTSTVPRQARRRGDSALVSPASDRRHWAHKTQHALLPTGPLAADPGVPGSAGPGSAGLGPPPRPRRPGVKGTQTLGSSPNRHWRERDRTLHSDTLLRVADRSAPPCLWDLLSSKPPFGSPAKCLRFTLLRPAAKGSPTEPRPGLRVP